MEFKDTPEIQSYCMLAYELLKKKRLADEGFPVHWEPEDGPFILSMRDELEKFEEELKERIKAIERGKKEE